MVPPTSPSAVMNGAGPHTSAVPEGAVDDELARMQAELASAKRELATARQRAAAREAASSEAIRAEVTSSREALADLERRHHEAVRMVREAADAEVTRILAGARTAASSITGSIPPAQLPPPSLESDVG
jgi:hypothetical protein